MKTDQRYHVANDVLIRNKSQLLSMLSEYIENPVANSPSYVIDIKTGKPFSSLEVYSLSGKLDDPGGYVFSNMDVYNFEINDILFDEGTGFEKTLYKLLEEMV